MFGFVQKRIKKIQAEGEKGENGRERKRERISKRARKKSARKKVLLLLSIFFFFFLGDSAITYQLPSQFPSPQSTVLASPRWIKIGPSVPKSQPIEYRSFSTKEKIARSRPFPKFRLAANFLPL